MDEEFRNKIEDYIKGLTEEKERLDQKSRSLALEDMRECWIMTAKIDAAIQALDDLL